MPAVEGVCAVDLGEAAVIVVVHSGLPLLNSPWLWLEQIHIIQLHLLKLIHQPERLLLGKDGGFLVSIKRANVFLDQHDQLLGLLMVKAPNSTQNLFVKHLFKQNKRKAGPGDLVLHGIANRHGSNNLVSNLDHFLTCLAIVTQLLKLPDNHSYHHEAQFLIDKQLQNRVLALSRPVRLLKPRLHL